MKRIALLTNSARDTNLKYANAAVKLLSKLGCVLYLPDSDKELIKKTSAVVFCSEQDIFKDAECVIVFGGDGTIMRTAHRTSLPILGVNLGRIGYIAEIELDEINLLSELVNDNFTIENRMMISCSVNKKDGAFVKDTSVLNEIVLSKGGNSVMPEIELICNGEEVGKYFADGLIAATPTGSTAYSLASGGSIVDPGMECFCVTPIAPQSFYAKPLVFSGGSVLTFKKGVRGHGSLYLINDGEYVTEICDEDTVTVCKSEKVTKLIKIKKNNFYSVMRSKMTEI